MKRIIIGSLALLVVCLGSAAASEGDGTVSGVVIDGFTGQPVVGATIEVEGTNVTLKTQVGGSFVGTVPAGMRPALQGSGQMAS